MILKQLNAIAMHCTLALSVIAPAYALEFQTNRPKKITHEKLERIKQKYQEKKELNNQYSKENARALEDFQGWWQVVTRDELPFGFGNFTDDVGCYIFIDTTADPITVTPLFGTVELPRFPTNLDAAGGAINSNFYYLASPTSLVHVLDLDGPDFNPYDGQSWWALELQADGETICAIDQSRPYYSGYQPVGCVYKKIDAPPQPIRPFDDTSSAFPDITNPVAIAQYIYNALTHNYNQGQNIHYGDEDYRTFYEREQIFMQLTDEGFTFTTPIRRIRVSRPGEHFVAALNRQFLQPTPFLTTDVATDIFTDGFSFATTGATVTINGFVGPWVRMNGTYVNGVAVTEEGAVPNPRGSHVDINEDQTRGTFRNVFNHFLLDFDSSDMPHDEQGWGLAVCGNPTVTVTHRITADMEYPAFRAAIEAMFYLMYQVSLHNRYNAYFRPGSIFLIDTWDELKQAAATNTFWGSALFPGANLINTRSNQSVPSSFYNNAVLARRGVTTYNDPFGLTQAPGSTYDYNIVMGNYLDQNSIKNLYWAIAGTPDLTPAAPNGEPLQFDPVDVGYKPTIPGPQRAEFVGTLGNVTVVNGIPQPQNPDPTHYTLIGFNPLTDRDYSNALYVALIDPALTNGKKVGYFRVQDELFEDPLSYIPSSTFAPVNAAPPPGNVKYGREAASRVYSNLIRYFVDVDCDVIIMDIRGNLGGFPDEIYNVAEFFGADRGSFLKRWALNDASGNSQLIDLGDGTQYAFFQDSQGISVESFGQFYVSQNETTNPGSVFKGSANRPKRLIILTDTQAGSAGDVLPYFFLGENFDGNMGSFTTTTIIGDIDGRIKGGASQQNPPPVSEFANRLYNPIGLPFAPIRFAADSPGAQSRVIPEDIFYLRQPEGTSPSQAPSLNGTAGGTPLPNDWSTNVWPALGFIPPYPGLFDPRIPKGLPVANVPETARDPWLEQCILLAVYGNN